MTSLALPTSVEWKLVPNRMPERRIGCAAVSSPEQDMIIVVGGHSNDNAWHLSRSSCRVLDIKTRTWKFFPPMTMKRNYCEAVLHNNSIYALGGFGENQCQDSVESCRLDDDHDRVWQRTPSMLGPHASFASCVVKNSILAIGGFEMPREGREVRTVEQFNPDTQTWTRLPDMIHSRVGCFAVAVEEKVYVFGGVSGSPKKWLDTAEVYDTCERTWKNLPRMPRARRAGTAVALGKHILLLGGIANEEGEFTDVVDCLDTITLQWMVGMPPLITARVHCAAVCVGTEVFLIGGKDEDYGLDTVETLSIDPYFLTVSRFLPLLQQDDLPLALWPYILAASECSPGIIYHILCCHRFQMDAVFSSCR